jgi:hypothetical protein
MLPWCLLSFSLGASTPSHGRAAAPAKASSIKAAPENGPDAELALLISEGLNWLDTGRDDMAQKSFLEVLKRDPRSPDAFLNLGILHLRRKLLDPAIEYFRKADSNRERFLLPRTALEVHLYLAAAWRQYRRPDLEEAALHTLLKRVTGLPDGGIRGKADQESHAEKPSHDAKIFLHPAGADPVPELDEEGVPLLTEERVAGGKALFALALLARSQARSMESRLYFEKSIAFSYFRRSAHLYLAHWYAVRSQDDVDSEVVAWTKAHPGFKKKGEDRSFYLKRHARLMEEADAAGQDEAELLVSPPVVELREGVRRALKILEGELSSPAPNATPSKGTHHDSGRKPGSGQQH